MNTLVHSPVNTLTNTLVNTHMNTHVNALVSTLVNTLVNTPVSTAANASRSGTVSTRRSPPLPEKPPYYSKSGLIGIYVYVYHNTYVYICIYVRVTLPGNVEFIRVCHATSSITRSGRMPHDMFPKWAKKNFAVITIQIAEVSSKTTVSTQWAVREVLQEAQNQPEFEFDATWSMPSYIVPLILAWRG